LRFFRGTEGGAIVGGDYVCVCVCVFKRNSGIHKFKVLNLLNVVVFLS